MDKEAVSRKTLSKIDPFAPFRFYNKHIGRRPALEIPMLTAGSAFLGSEAADRLGYSRSVGAGLTGLIALLYGVGKHIDLSGDWTNALQSLIQTDYYKKHPEAARALKRSGRKKIHYAKPVTGKVPPGRRLLQAAIPGIASGLQKEQSEKRAIAGADELDQEVIPVNYSSLLVEADPFLAPNAKQVTIGLLQGSQGADAGMTSGKKLFKAAVRAGAGYGTAYMFGRGLTSVLGAGTEVSKKLSKIGGVAAAVVNSGILNEIGERL